MPLTGDFQLILRHVTNFPAISKRYAGERRPREHRGGEDARPFTEKDRVGAAGSDRLDIVEANQAE